MWKCLVTLCLLSSLYLTFASAFYSCSNQSMPDHFKCINNFITNISCTWYSKSYTGDGPFLVKFEDEQCTLLKMPHDENKFSCNITYVLDETVHFNITVEDYTTKEILAKIVRFIASCHIKLDPPANLSYKINGTTYKIMWKGYEGYYGSANLQYELQLKKDTSSWENAKQKRFYDKENDDQSEELVSSEFELGSDYDLRLRCKTEAKKYYWSQWSEWSSELRIQALGAKDESKVNIIYILTVICPLATTCILLYVVFCSSLGRRLKIPFLKEVPTAANFFKPLYIVHNGNFQDWTNYPNKCVRRKQEGRYRNSVDSILHVSTILCFQKETISPIKVEAPTVTNEVSVTEKTCDVTSCSGLLQNKEISLSEHYPSFSPDFSLFNEEEEQNVSEVDCPTIYFSYNGTCLVNSVETED